jgi:hypothetical protein
MKKLFLALSSVSFVIKAEDEMESIGEQMSDAMSDMVSKADDMISSLSYKMKIMIYWSSLSSLHKMVIIGLAGLAVLWIICKLMHCRTASCSCGCGSKNCKCHKR